MSSVMLQLLVPPIILLQRPKLSILNKDTLVRIQDFNMQLQSSGGVNRGATCGPADSAPAPKVLVIDLEFM